ncbi:AAA family ATPase [Nonomuraea sp. SMC257]|uniref:AAA family ATPase n=1 Tax=Nonomuraea montanisoli TaxID=2741721 RepID=A0A7Y6M3E3_9ACTN|nr:AAA family ATPase [Nonomuraea montanisoli]NUW32360.1 AAA family ATPase [Nonomuraea montanisoli]
MLVVLVNGLPGAGKTTLAKPLAHELGLPLFSKDRIKETLADHIGITPPAGLTGRQWSRRLGVAAGETLWALLADSRQGAVLESFWPVSLRPVVVGGLHRAGVQTAHEVRCTVPPAIARQRYEEREASRHPIHQGILVSDQHWEQRTLEAEPLDLHHTYHVDTTWPVDVRCLATEIRRNSNTGASGEGTPAPG